MKATSQQKIIIAADIQPGQSLVVDAAAGTGKTAAAVGYAYRNPRLRILYVTFSNKAARDAESKFLKANIRNTTVSTIHGLASAVKKRYAHKFKERIHYKEIQNLVGGNYVTAWKIQESIRLFCESDARALTNEHVAHTKAADKDELLPLCKIVLSAMGDPAHPFPISFDGYLKIFQLGNPILPFDTIIIDEAQDSNPVTISIMRSQTAAAIILIGDDCQQIHTWRGAVNAMGQWHATFRTALTESFRFGSQIARVANLILKNFQHADKTIRGLRPQDSLAALDRSQPHTVITRTNATLYGEAISAIEAGHKIHFSGTDQKNNWDPTIPYKFRDAEDVFQLFIRNPAGVRGPYFKEFTSYQELKEIADGPPDADNEKAGDKELRTLTQLVEKYHTGLPDLLQSIKLNCVSPDQAHVTLTTAHRSKGLEWDNVYLADDFVELIVPETKDPSIKRLSIPDGDSPVDEYNLLYVAVTRARHNLDLNQALRDLILDYSHLTPGFHPAAFELGDSPRSSLPSNYTATSHSELELSATNNNSSNPFHFS